MKKLFLFTILFTSLGHVSLAQEDDLPAPKSKPDKVDNRPDDFVGFKSRKKVDLSKFIIEPVVNFSIGQGSIDVGLSPYVGYKIFTPKYASDRAGNAGLFAGGGITYFYSGRNLDFTDGAYNYRARAKFHTYGGGVFLQYNIWRGFFTRARFEVLHRKLDNVYATTFYYSQLNSNTRVINFEKIEKTIPALLIGVGYNLLQSKNFFFPIVVSYNVLQPFTRADQKAYSLYSRGLVIQLGFINIF